MIKFDQILMSDYNELFYDWFKNLWTEKYFWKSYVTAERIKGFEEITLRYMINKPQKKYLKHLEIGCGPIPPIAINFVNPEQSEIIYSDPLVPFYKELWDHLGFKLPSDFMFSICEFADSFFGDEVFDTISMRNALDHTINPLMCLLAMLSCLKTGGKIQLLHRVNEAEHEKYTGLHKWNISGTEDDILISNRTKIFSLKSMMGSCCEIKSEFLGSRENPNDYIIFSTITKKSKIVKSEIYISTCNRLLANILSLFASRTIAAENKRERILEKLRDKTYIFGAGNLGAEAYQYLTERGIVVRGFLDNDKAKLGGTKFDLPILSPESIDRTSVILISALDEMGISETIKSKFTEIYQFSDLCY